MTERFTLDRPSFEQVLCATSLIQQLNRRLRNSFTPDNDIQPLSDLVETQLAIETGTIDLEAAMNRVVGLAMKLGRATGVATWLFTGREFVYRAGTGTVAISNDERLQLEVLSKLASIFGASDHSSSHDPRESNAWNPAPDAIHYPGSVKSLLVAPIFHGRSIAGALAVFSTEFNAFTERDATRARLLSGLLAYALGKAAEAELKQNVSLERAAMLQVIDQLIPALKMLAEEDKLESRRSPNRFPSVVTELETVEVPGTILQEPGADVLESCASTSIPRLGSYRTELSPLDSPTLQAENGQTRDVSDNLSRSASLAPKPICAPESICVPAQADISTPPISIQVAAAGIPQNAPFSSPIGLTKLATRQLTKARFWLSTTMGITLEDLSSITRHLRISTATQAAVFLIMLAFVVLITTAGHRSKTVATTSETSAAATMAPDKSGASGTSRVTQDLADSATVSERSQNLHQHSGPVPASQVSHMQVTDPAISSALGTISRYEIAGLRRRAEYGDDMAALLLGMAYETGHLVPQNCVKGAQWVATSASEGNAAAQYNLGLRYREGDGVPFNPEAGASWLRKAAAQKYAQAHLALKSVP